MREADLHAVDETVAEALEDGEVVMVCGVVDKLVDRR